MPLPVVPLVGTWIETYGKKEFAIREYVVPLVGTWIETSGTAIKP